MGTLESLLLGFSVAFQPDVLWYAFLGCLVGTVVGVLPGIGPLTATTIYAWVGDVRRFPHAKQLAAYAGLVPAVRQSGGTVHVGGITKQGAPALRATLVQAAHVLLSRCRGADARPLQAIGLRIRGTRGRRKIAVVAVARHLLRIAYYILRDGTTYDAHRLGTMTDAA